MKLLKIVIFVACTLSYAPVLAKAISGETYGKWTGFMLTTGIDEGNVPIALKNFILIEGGIFYDKIHSIVGGTQLALQDKIQKTEGFPWDTDLQTSLNKLRSVNIANVITKYLAKNPGKK